MTAAAPTAKGSDMDLERRIRRLEDRAELNDLIVDYFLASDGDDFEGIAASFTEDAVFSASGAPAGKGRAGITAFIRGARAHMGLTLHTPNYVRLRFEDDDHASGIVGAHLELVIGNETLFGAVRYIDAYRREDGRWRIAARDMRTIHIAPWSDVGEAMASATPARWTGAEPGQSDYPRR